MGASEFFTRASGKSAKEAFSAAVDNAAWQHGHGGYTGTIAEKGEFKMASQEVFETIEKAKEFAESKMSDDNHWCQDKWGPAACVSYKYGDRINYLFFGWASD